MCNTWHRWNLRTIINSRIFILLETTFCTMRLIPGRIIFLKKRNSSTLIPLTPNRVLIFNIYWIGISMRWITLLRSTGKRFYNLGAPDESNRRRPPSAYNVATCLAKDPNCNHSKHNKYKAGHYKEKPSFTTDKKNCWHDNGGECRNRRIGKDSFPFRRIISNAHCSAQPFKLAETVSKLSFAAPCVPTRSTILVITLWTCSII